MSRRPLRRGRGKKKSRVKLPPPTTVTIESLESKGVGAATLPDGKRVFVPGVLPDDEVEIEFVAARGDGYSARILNLAKAQERRPPDCPVFMSCGGCQLQHLPDPLYQEWKSGLLLTAFARQGITAEFRPMRRAPLSSRRRVSFSAINTSSGVTLGFKAQGSNQIVDLVDCPRLLGGLNQLIEPLRNLSATIMPKNSSGRFQLTILEGNKLDMVIETDIELDLKALEALSNFAHTNGVTRLTHRTSENFLEPIVELEPVLIKMGGVDVPLPPDSFLQPSTEGAHFLTDLVLETIEHKGTIFDLYAGVGTFTFPLLTKAREVLAVDGAPDQIAAIQSASNQNPNVNGVTTMVRDLQRNPLLADELNKADIVVFDPPRAGAREQSVEIAKSTVPHVIAVSCNPATLARDVRILQDGGYEIRHVTPVDQFPMSYHLEAVAVLERPD